MKNQITKITISAFFAVAVVLTSCMNDKYDDLSNNVTFTNFDFKTTADVNVSISTLNSQNSALSGVFVKLYTRNPLNADGSLIADSENYLIYKGVTNSSGKLNCKIAPATTADTLTVLINSIGLPQLNQYKIESNMSITIGGTNASVSKVSSQKRVAANNSAVSLPTPTKVNGYYVLGSWDSNGLPSYLWSPGDIIENDFLADVNATLPERVKLTVSHPEYLSTTAKGGIVLIEDAEVWVTFVHEGAGNLNSLGYYTHPTSTPPSSASSITDATIIFPNSSFSGSGGALASGNKVQLLYLDPATGKYTTEFPKGTTVAWFLKSPGFSGGNITKSGTVFYSDLRFNPESTEEKRIHNVLLKDNARKLLLLGFEDLNRDGSSDEDFNDAIFYSTVTPYTAIQSDFYKPIDTPLDTDNDGIGDTMDEYPTDPAKAFNNYYPAKNIVGTLAFEDLWPHRGDYDFNDLVVDYNFNQITNADNKVVEIDASLTVRAIGASSRNGFALMLNTSNTNIKSVTGQSLVKDIFSIAANGAENRQAKAVIPVFDDAFTFIGKNGFVNTVQGEAYTNPKTATINIKLNTPVAISDFGTPPYNAFIVIDSDRTKEVHLPGSAPTELADVNLFGTEDDNSNLAIAKYYMSDKYLPWAINLPVQFNYPSEKQDITKTHLMFNPWAVSRGYNFMDWYVNKSGYRDDSKIYKK